MDVDQLSDDELASSAYVWHLRARQGDEHAKEVAARLDRALKQRLADTPSSHGALEQAPGAKPWWRFW